MIYKQVLLLTQQAAHYTFDQMNVASTYTHTVTNTNLVYSILYQSNR